MHVERGLNLSQVITYEYVDHANDGGMPVISLAFSGGSRSDYRGEDARYIFRLLRGRF